MTEAAEKVLRELRLYGDIGSVTPSGLAHATGLPYSTVWRGLRELARLGVVVTTSDDKGRIRYLRVQ